MSAIPSWAVRGAKVVCIDDGWDTSAFVDPAGLITFPAKEIVYTIREVRVRYVTEFRGGEVMIGLVLDEIVNPTADGGSATGEELGWHIDCFRPLTRLSAEKDVAEFFGHHLHQRQPESVE